MVIPIASYCVYNELQRRMEGRKLVSVQIFICKLDVPMQRSPAEIDFVERFGVELRPARVHEKGPEEIHEA